MIKVLTLTTATLFVLSGCSTGLKKEDDPGPSPIIVTAADAEPGSPGELYRNSRQLLEREQYETAINNFENLEATHPFSEYAAQASLDIAYAHYRLNEHQNAIDAADRFLRLYPGHEKADYAYYLKGLANFTRGRSIFESIVARQLHLLDQSALRLSFSDFTTLVNRYPGSAYAEDATARMSALTDAMALHELSTAEYYFERSAMVAAINRINAMLETYPTTNHKADGLALLARAHLALGNRDLAVQTVQSLEETQPDHPELRILSSLRG